MVIFISEAHLLINILKFTELQNVERRARCLLRRVDPRR